MSASRIAAAVICVWAGLLSSAIQAQQVYRIVGPDGKVTFSDRAPDGSAEDSQVVGTARGGSPAATPQLPFALRQITSRYPVTLYTSNGCAPCANARVLLMQRGIPFTERTVNTNDEIDALKRLASEASLPLLTIGAQQLKGFQDAEWTQYLDAAGYPKQSQLPASYRQPPATQLVPVVVEPATAPAPADAEPQSGARRPGTPRNPASPTNPATNPAGIIF